MRVMGVDGQRLAGIHLPTSRPDVLINSRLPPIKHPSLQLPLREPYGIDKGQRRTQITLKSGFVRDVP